MSRLSEAKKANPTMGGVGHRPTRVKHQSSSRGFSLIEVVVAMGILAMLLMGVLSSSGSTAQASIEVLSLIHI